MQRVEFYVYLQCKDNLYTFDIIVVIELQDQEQGRAVTEAVVASLLVQCSSHALQADFLITALQLLVKLGVVRWDSFLPILLRAAGTAEMSAPALSSNQGLNNVGQLAAQPTGPLALLISGVGTPAVSTPASPSPSSNLLTSPAHGNVAASPAHSSVEYSSMNASQLSSNGGIAGSGARVVNWLRPLVCRVMLAAMEGDLKPVTCMEILLQVVQWVQTWDADVDTKEEDGKCRLKNRKLESRMWLHSCVEVIWALIDETKCRVPFYALLHDRTQLQVLNIYSQDRIYCPCSLQIFVIQLELFWSLVFGLTAAILVATA